MRTTTIMRYVAMGIIFIVALLALLCESESASFGLLCAVKGVGFVCVYLLAAAHRRGWLKELEQLINE